LSRKGCEDYASRIEGSLLDRSDAAAVAHIFDFHLHRYKAVLESLAQYHVLRDLAMKGIAFHHSGVLPALKEVIELLFSRGLIKALFATETFAVGLNMPTKTAVFLDVRKYDEGLDGMRPLRPDEYAQMAGRAGRRGKDTQGLALYLPAHPPLEPGEMKRMMAGALSPLQSKLLLHYDFVLRVLQTGRVAFDLLLGRSFWKRQQGDILRALEHDMKEIAAKRLAIPLTDAQRAECATRSAVEAELAATVNAARKVPQRALEAWKNTHVGPRWESAWAAFITDGKLAAEEAVAAEHARIHRLPVSQSRLAPVVAVLRELGFIKLPADAESENEENALSRLGAADLTLKGVLATEVNEGNAILLPELYLSGVLREASAEEVVSVLGFFIEDREAESKSGDIGDMDFPPLVRSAAELLGTLAQRAQAVEDRFGIIAAPGFWTLRTLWADIGIRWMRGASAREICEENTMFEGTLLRGLSKLSNLLTEWIGLATYCEHVDVLDKLRDAPALLLRDIACIESLYLRL
jgi:superfamily II RNA helicase